MPYVVFLYILTNTIPSSAFLLSSMLGVYCATKIDGLLRVVKFRLSQSNFRHTLQYRGKSPDIKRQALELYLEGLGLRSIGRFLKCSHVAVYNWIKAFGEAVKELRSEPVLEVVEMDEMHTYVSLKKTTMDMDCCCSIWEKVRQLPATRQPINNWETPWTTKKSDKCDSFLETLRAFRPKRHTYTSKSRNVYS